MARTMAMAGDFWRQADEPARRGIKISVESFSGEHVATSSADFGVGHETVRSAPRRGA